MTLPVREEVLRKAIHVGAGGLAFAVRPLGFAGTAAMAGAALLFNLFLLPAIGGRRLWRVADRERGQAVGIVLYPLAVLLLVLAFHRRLEVAAAVWGILAFGDGAASLAGTFFGGARLPWNGDKSWIGSAACCLFGTVGATTLLLWTAPGRYSFAFAFAVGAVTALVATAVESLPLGLDDNLSVPLLAALTMACLLATQGRLPELLDGPSAGRLLVGVVVNLALAGLAYAIGGVDRSGAVAGTVLGAVIYACLDWRGIVLLMAFFGLGTGLTRLGYAAKAAARLAQEHGGRRGARHAVANAAVAAAAAFFAAATGEPGLFVLAFAGALAAAAADTAGSEVGQLWGSRTFLITDLSRVPRGTQGGISAAGTAAGAGAALLLGALGAVVGLYPPQGAAVAAAAGLLGSLLDSVLGATLERRGDLDNEAVNFLATLSGALAAAAAGWLLR